MHLAPFRQDVPADPKSGKSGLLNAQTRASRP